jgi:predicted transcriptional regulator
VLVLAWEGGRKGVTVRELYEQMRAERPIAYTTVMTELGSLTTKGLLVCDSSQTVYRYRPAIPPRRVRGTILDQIVAVFYRGQAAPAVARLLGLASLTENGLEQLRREGQRLQS